MQIVYSSNKMLNKEGKPFELNIETLSLMETSEGLKIVAIPQTGQNVTDIFSVTIPGPLDLHSRPKPV